MSNHEEFIRRATEKLEVDRELQLDVAAELRAHMEDAHEEFRDAGCSDQEAAVNAAKVIGDPDELSEELFQANRFRMRIRGILRWAARLTLIPAAILIIGTLALNFTGVFQTDFPKQIPESWMTHLTEDERFVLRGDPSDTTELERAKSIHERWPDDPIFYAHFAIEYLGTYANQRRMLRNPEAVSQTLAVLDKGETIDPDNAWYNFQKAWLLIGSSSKMSDDKTRTCQLPDCRTSADRHYYQKIEIHDTATFQRGLEEFYAGLPKERCTALWREMIDRRIELLPEPDNITNVFQRIIVPCMSNLPLATYNKLARSIGAYALQLADEGNPEALQLNSSNRLMSMKAGSGSQLLVEMLVANIATQRACMLEEHLLAQLGRPGDAEKVRRLNEELASIEKMSRGTVSVEFAKSSGMFWNFWTVFDVEKSLTMENFQPMRTAEHILATQIALLGLLAVLIVIAAILATAAVESLFARKANKGLLLFVGWKQIARICLASILIPLSAYGLYLYLQISPLDAYGINYTATRTTLEWTCVISLIVILLIGMSYRAIRRRAIHLGLTVPEPITFKKRKVTFTLVAIAASTVIIYIAGWWVGWFQAADAEVVSKMRLGREWVSPALRYYSPAGLGLSGFIVLAMLAWGLREAIAGLRCRKELLAFRRTLYRSVAPVMASAVILVGLVCGAGLVHIDGSTAVDIISEGSFEHRSEIENTGYRLMRDLMQQEHDQIMSEMYGSEARNALAKQYPALSRLSK